MKKSLKNRFCPLPFEHVAAFRKGAAYACCPSWLPVSVGDFSQQSLKDVWNSAKFALIRQSILDGSFRFCDKDNCPRIQTDSLPLRSEVTSEHLRKIIDENSVFIPDGPKELGLSADKSCNLSCPSCRKEKYFVASGPEYDNLRTLHQQLLQGALPELRRLVLSGSGDPLASKICREILTTLDGHRYPQLKIHLMSNGQLLNAKMWATMNKLHRNFEIIELGLDAGVAETYSSLRRGGKFSVVTRNIEFLVHSRATLNLDFKIWLTFVLQTTNYQEMPEFVKLGKKLGVDRCCFQRITDWKTYGKSQFSSHAIHLGEHPKHPQFLTVLKDPILRDPIVHMGNLQEFLPSSGGG